MLFTVNGKSLGSGVLLHVSMVRGSMKIYKCIKALTLFLMFELHNVGVKKENQFLHDHDQ